MAAIAFGLADRYRSKYREEVKAHAMTQDLELLAQETAAHYRHLFMTKCGITEAELDKARLCGLRAVDDSILEAEILGD